MYSFWTIPNSKKEIFFTKFADANVTKTCLSNFLIKNSYLWFTLWPKCNVFLIVMCFAARISLNWVLLYYKLISWKIWIPLPIVSGNFYPRVWKFHNKYNVLYNFLLRDLWWYVKIPEICLLITYFKFQTSTPYVFVALVWLCPSNDRNKLVNTYRKNV